MSALSPIKSRREEQDDHQSAATPEAVTWRATYTYQANGFKYTDEAAIRDVSRNGCGIRGRTRLAIGSKTTVTFYLGDRQRPLSVAAKVICMAGDLFGVQFLNLSKGSYERIQRYLQQGQEGPSSDVQQTPPISKDRRKNHLGLAVSLLVLGAFWGCGTLPAPVSAPSAPFFTPTSEERAALAQRASELEALAAMCAATSSCDEQTHFSRALLSLFANRDAARASFETVISLNPTSALANSSTLWLRVLSDEARPMTAADRPLLRELTVQWLRQSMARPVAVPTPQERTLDSARSALVQALHQVRERDRHIAHLRAQLEALKVINQEQEERRKMRPPASLVPRLEPGR